MNTFNPKEITKRLFRVVREEFDLGMEEYFAALKALEAGWGKNDLKEVLQLLWCHSLEQQGELQAEWDTLLAEINIPKQTEKSKHDQVSLLLNQEENKLPPPKPFQPLPQKKPQPLSEVKFAPLPVQTPTLKPTQITDSQPFHTYYPISRRSMTYSLRYLRRLVAYGPETVLNVEATIEKVTRQGFFLEPVYIKQKQNQAHLLLLIDQNGSMTPFHRFSRDLVETARYESDLHSERVDVAYFHNVPAENVYQDIYLTQPLPLLSLLAKCDRHSNILIISDAGAARGYRRMSRIRATTKILRQIQRYTEGVAWLNPMSKERWTNTSAQVLQYLVPMFPMNKEGLNQAIDTVRGISVN